MKMLIIMSFCAISADKCKSDSKTSDVRVREGNVVCTSDDGTLP